MLETHESLKSFSQWVARGGALISAGFSGWLYALSLQKQRIDDNLKALSKTTQDQWNRIDFIKENYFKKSEHEAFKNDIYHTIDNIIKPLGGDIKRLDISINHLTERLDKFLEKELK